MGQQAFENVVSAERQWALGRMAAEEFLSSAFDNQPSAITAAWLAGPQALGRADMEAAEAALRMIVFVDAIDAYSQAALSEAQIAPARQAYWRAWGRLDAQGAERDALEVIVELGDPEHGLHAKFGGWSSIFASLAMAWSGAENDLDDEADALVLFVERCVSKLGGWAADGVLHMLLALAGRLNLRERSSLQRAHCADLCWEILGLLSFEDEKRVVAAFDSEARRQGFAQLLL